MESRKKDKVGNVKHSKENIAKDQRSIFMKGQTTRLIVNREGMT